MNIKTAWLKPPPPAGGVDHLGIQQPPSRIFSTLLPGLTVVTDRVSNYAFYPWLAWAHDKDGERIGLDFIDMLRRAECLLALIAERHAQVLDEHELLHSRGLVGRNTLVPLLREDAPRPIPLAEVAAPRSGNEKSYFKHPAGGLGQYYLGPLRELGVLRRVGERFDLSADIGVPLANAHDGRVDRQDFLRILKRGTVEKRDLDRLSSFCPCRLADHTPERELLIDLLFARKDQREATDDRRRQTLLLLLDLASHRGSSDSAPLDTAFRAACFTRALDDGSPWQVPEQWQAIRRAWATYQRNDELAIAVLGIFWVALFQLDDRGGWAASSRDVGMLTSQVASAALGENARLTVGEAIAARRGSLPPLSEWSTAGHEFRSSLDVRTEARAANPERCLSAAVATLLALAARHSEAYPYREVAIPVDYLTEYPLNLHSFHEQVAGRWQTLTVADWLGVLATEWGVEAHLRVALRKMRYESRDKFLLYVTDDGIRRRPATDRPLPDFTASRLNRAVHFLVDLGLATWDEAAEGLGPFSGEWVARISPLGRQLREDLG